MKTDSEALREAFFNIIRENVLRITRLDIFRDRLPELERLIIQYEEKNPPDPFHSEVVRGFKIINGELKP